MLKSRNNANEDRCGVFRKQNHNKKKIKTLLNWKLAVSQSFRESFN